MTKREKQQLLSSLHAIAHDIAGGLMLAALIVGLAFLFSIR